ncbi:MAG: ABC transporter substrate-binding protein [Chlorobiaceae bacterium]|jgi:branched-chain amino acid transport system substrate-binding protein
MNASRSILAFLLATSFSTVVTAADVVKIAITGPFSGGSAPMGVSMRDGAKLAISQINQNGGINVGCFWTRRPY